MFSRMLAMAILIGMALLVCELMRRVRTLLSLQFEQIEINVFLTSSDMNELVSKVFLMSLVKIASRSESSIFFILLESSFNVMTAFLLRFDLRLSISLMISGINILMLD